MTTTMNTKPTTTILLRTILIITNPIRIFFPFLSSYCDQQYPYLITKYNLFQSIPLVVVQQPESTSLSSSLSSLLHPTILPVLFQAVIGIVIGLYYGYYICYKNYKKYSVEQQQQQRQQQHHTGRYTRAFTTTTNYSNNYDNNNNNNNDDEEILLQTISQQYRIEYYYLWFVAFVSYGGMNASAIGYQLLLYPTTTIITTTTSLNEPSNTSSSSSYSLLSGGDMTNRTTTTPTTKLLLYQSRTIFWACDCYCTGIAAIGMILSFIVVFQLLLVPTHIRMNLLNQLYYHSQIHDQNNNNNNNTNNNNRTQQDQQDVGDENASDMSPTKTTESKQQQQQQQQQNNKYSTGNDRDKNSKDTTDDFNNDTSFVVSSKDEIPSSLSLLSPSSYYYYRIWKFVAWIGFIVGILTLYYVLIDIPNSIHPSTNNRNGTIPIFPYTAFLELWYVLPSELCVVVGFVVTTILYIEDRKVIQKNSNRNWNLYYSWPYYAMFLSPFVFFMGLFCEGYIITWFQTIVTPWIMNTTTTTTTTILPFVLLIRRFVYYIVYWIGYGTTATPMAFFGTNIAFLGIGNWIHTNFPIIFSNQFGNNNNNNDDDDHTKDDDDKNKSSNKNSKNIDSSKSIREKKDI